MLTLILNSMEGPLQLILAIQDSPGSANLRPLAQKNWEARGQGVESLIPALKDILDKNALKREQISGIACVRGPGSFTGIRLVLTTALALSRALPSHPVLAGLDYLPLLAQTAAENISDMQGPYPIWTLTHARRGQVHTK